jgi:hypothetical protein
LPSFQGKANSIHLAELPKPSVHEVPNGRGVLVQVLRVGVLTVQTRKSTQRNTAKNSELLAEIGAHYISTQETTIKAAADKYGPFDLMFEATGFAPIVFEAMEHLGKNGVLILSSVTGGAGAFRFRLT